MVDNHKDNKARIAQAKRLKLCASCLRKDQGKCTTIYLRPCTYCKGHHFDKLCPAPNTDKHVVEAAITLTLSMKKNIIYCSQCKCPCKSYNEKVTCWDLLDQGSQRTFTKRKSLENLQCDIAGKETLHLQEFTGYCDKRDYDIVQDSYVYRKQKQHT